jgi:hypothetical protein
MDRDPSCSEVFLLLLKIFELVIISEDVIEVGIILGDLGDGSFLG